MNRSHVIRLNPTPEQEVYFRKACGVARHAYNWALARWKEARAEGKRVKMKDLKAEYNKIKGEQFPWCYEVTKCAPEQAFADLGQAFANYWRMKEEGTQPKLKHPRKDGEEAGFPHFKSKKRDRLSFYLANDKFSVEGHTLRVPKLGNVNMTEALRFQGKQGSAAPFSTGRGQGASSCRARRGCNVSPPRRRYAATLRSRISRTFSLSASGMKGLRMKSTPGSSTPWLMMASSA